MRFPLNGLIIRFSYGQVSILYLYNDYGGKNEIETSRREIEK